jgi:hypothetical protein
MTNTDVNTGSAVESSDHSFDLPIWLIDPVQGYPVWPLTVGPVGPVSQQEPEKDGPNWWDALAIIGAAAGALHFIKPDRKSQDVE